MRHERVYNELSLHNLSEPDLQRTPCFGQKLAGYCVSKTIKYCSFELARLVISFFEGEGLGGYNPHCEELKITDLAYLIFRITCTHTQWFYYWLYREFAYSPMTEETASTLKG